METKLLIAAKKLNFVLRGNFGDEPFEFVCKLVARSQVVRCCPIAMGQSEN